MVHHHSLSRWGLGLLLMLLLNSLLIPAAQAAPAQCFPETTYCLEGPLLTFWEQNGGLPVFGMPITPAQNEVNPDTGQSHMSQWLERNRFEFHPENKAPYNVLLGRLGDERLRQMGIDWQTQPKAYRPQPGCLWFEQTGHNVCNQDTNPGFKAYWETHGLEFDGQPGTSYAESLALFGLPLTEPGVEINSSGDSVLTQWFERARFEWHFPSRYHPNFRVLLGLLGSEIRSNQAPPPAAPEWTTRWLRGIPCTIPCWEGVTPGVTPGDDAVPTLNQSPIIYRAELYYSHVPAGNVTFQWSWKNIHLAGGYGSFEAGTGLVAKLSPNYPDNTFTLDQIRAAHGDPEYVVAQFKKGNNYDMSRTGFVYLSKGLVLWVWTMGQKPQFTPRMAVEPDFIAPGQAAFNRTYPVGYSFGEQFLVPWQGLKDFDFYCRTSTGEPCQ